MPTSAGPPQTRRRDPIPLRIARALVAPLAALALRLLGASWRVEVVGGDPFDRPEGSPILAAMWHADVLVAVTLYRDRGGVVPVSRSRDGENITAVLRHLGFGEIPRGSSARDGSSRGGTAALRSVVRCLGTGRPVAILVDGPRGPAGVPQPGIIAAARISGQPILPVGFAARPRIRFASWDRTQLPLPFARVVVAYGEEMPVAKDPTNELEEAALEDLARRLQRAQEAAQARLDA